MVESISFWEFHATYMSVKPKQNYFEKPPCISPSQTIPQDFPKFPHASSAIRYKTRTSSQCHEDWRPMSWGAWVTCLMWSVIWMSAESSSCQPGRDGWGTTQDISQVTHADTKWRVVTFRIKRRRVGNNRRIICLSASSYPREWRLLGGEGLEIHFTISIHRKYGEGHLHCSTTS